MAFDKNNTSLFMKVVIVLFAVILVVSLCLPFFSGCTSATTGASSSDDASSSSSSSTATTVAGVQEQYATLIDSLKGRLESDPTNATYMVSLANNYMDCAIDMLSASDADANEATVVETFSLAVEQYDAYLAAVEGDDSVTEASLSAVAVDRLVCLFYTGEEDEAIEGLEAFLEETPDYAMGWYNLGAFYEQQGDTDKAKEAYNEAVELDPDGEAGAGTYAQYRLLLIQLTEQAASDADGETDGDAAADDATDAADAGEGTDGEAADAETDGGSSDADAADETDGTTSDTDASDNGAADAENE